MERKRIYAFIIPLVIVGILAAFCGWGYSRLSTQEELVGVDLYTLVPADCEAVLETKDIDALRKTIQSSPYINRHGLEEVSYLMGLLVHHIETFSRQQAHGLSTEMNRQLLVSFHQPGSTHDQVVYGRLGNGDIGHFTKLMQQSTGSAFPPKKLKYKGEEIVIYPLGKDFLACYFKSGFFALSLQEKLIEKVIDSYMEEKESLGRSAAFDTLRKQTKHNEQLALYLPAKGDDEAWAHFEIRMNESAIYLTSNHSLADTYGQIGEEMLVERTDGGYLPKQVLMMVQSALNLPDTLNETTESHTLSQVMGEHGAREVTSIRFSPSSSDTEPHQLLIIPLHTDRQEELKQDLRFSLGAKRRPSIWTRDFAVPVWQCEADSLLSTYFILPPSTPTECWAGIWKESLLLATGRETLQTYIEEMQTNTYEEGTSHEAFQQSLGDLAEQANYTLVADMNSLVNSDSTECDEYYSMIPSFFFKHKEFFKHFMLSVQHINHDEQVHTHLILSFHGDSTLLRQPTATTLR